MKGPFTLPELVVLAIIITGLILEWLKIDSTGICMNLGFGLMGVMGLIEAISRENRTRPYRGFLVAFPILMIILSAKALVEHEASNFSTMAVVLIFYSMLVGRERTRSPKEK